MSVKMVQVVVIDDDEDDFKIVKDLLYRGAFGVYEPLWVNSYAKGLQMLKEARGDVFLLDYQLGEKSGLDLLREAGGRAVGKPVIMLTGTEDTEVDLAAMEAGAAYFVSKSSLVSDHLLERTIRYAIKAAQNFSELLNIDRLKHEKEDAQSASDAKNLFLANVSHEIRTPLGAIMGFTDLARSSGTCEEKDKFLEVIKRNASHLLTLVNDLLDLSKIEAGKYDVSPAPCDWRAVVQEVIQTLHFTAQSKGDRIRFLDQQTIPQYLSTDTHCLKQILLNLIGNAVKFTDAGSIEIAAEYAHDLVLKVRDTGKGISKSQRPNLFQPFTQGEAGLHRRYGGTGLGLHLSRKMAKALGGEIKLLESEPGKGSTFALSLPAVWSHAPVKEEVIRSDLERHLKGLSILLAEDSEDIQLLVRHILSQAGASVDVASNGRIALNKMSVHRYDVVLMDIQMPEMDGFEAIKHIRALGYRTPIVALSAHAMTGDHEKALDLGFSHYLTKPIQSDKLLRTLARYNHGGVTYAESP
jgi:signal transduction histidine kinase